MAVITVGCQYNVNKLQTYFVIFVYFIYSFWWGECIKKSYDAYLICYCLNFQHPRLNRSNLNLDQCLRKSTQVRTRLRGEEEEVARLEQMIGERYS